MINPISFLWRQFNGPQITAICQAIWQYFHDTYDAYLNYFHSFGIDTVTQTDHLTFIGILQGLARPLIPIPDENTFWFTEVYGYKDGNGMEPITWYAGHKIPDAKFPDDHGFSSLNDIQRGGKFQEVSDPGGYDYIPDYIFRALLRGNASSEGLLGSLVALDDMLYEVWKKDRPTTVPAYVFTWANPTDNPRYTPADIFVNLGVTQDWNHPYEVQAEIKLLGNTVYYPIPKLIPVLREGETELDPAGWVRILVATQAGVYGLDAMWAGIGTPSDTAAGPDPDYAILAISDTELQTMWTQNNSWADEEAPGGELVSLTDEEIHNMWN